MSDRDDVWFLDRFSRSWENVTLCDQLGNRGFRARIVDWADLSISGGTGDIIYRSQPTLAPRLAVVKSRVITRRSDTALALVYDGLEALEEKGARITNSAAAIRRCRNKLRQASLLARAGLPVPDTRAVAAQEDVERCMADWGEVVLKPVWGHASMDVTRMRPGGRLTEEGGLLGIREEIISWHLLEQHGLLCAQPFIPNLGRDLRITMVGATIASAVYHVATSPDGSVRHFLYPLRVEPAVVTTEVERIVNDAMRVLGLDSAVIDLVESPEGPVIIEVNEGLTVWQALEGTEHDLTPRGFTALVADHLATLAAETASSNGCAPNRSGSDTGRPDSAAARSSS